jgi:hypothetical protein
VSIPYFLYFSNFAIVIEFLLCLSHRLSVNRPTYRREDKSPSDGHCQCEKEMDDHLLASQQIFEREPHSDRVAKERVSFHFLESLTVLIVVL